MKIKQEIKRLENIMKYYKCTTAEVQYIDNMINELKKLLPIELPKKAKITNKSQYTKSDHNCDERKQVLKGAVGNDKIKGNEL